MYKKFVIALALSLLLISSAGASTVIWDFENGDAHNFTLWSVIAPGQAVDEPDIAGDESLTGIGLGNGLPDAGLAWTVGPPNQFDGLKPTVAEGARINADGLLDYSLGTEDIPAESGTLNTYNLNQDGDQLHSAANDQIATSPAVTLEEGVLLTVWYLGGGNNTHAPDYDADPTMMYSDGSSGIAVLSAEEDDMYAILGTIHTQGQETLTEVTLDLSEFAGRKVYIEVVDAFEGNGGWLAIDKIQITNAIVKTAGLIVQFVDGEPTMGFDIAQIDRLEMLGYNVILISQDDVRDGVFTIADADALDVLVISESISSTRADNLIGTSAPTMHQEAYGWDNHYFMGAAMAINWYTGSEVSIVNDTHPIIADAGLSAGPMTFFDPENSWTAESVSNLAPGAELLAKITVDNADYAIVFAIEKGAELANGNPAASRIVGFSLPGTEPTITAEQMTDEAWAIFDAAIRWLDPPPPTAAMVVNPDDLSAGFDKAQHDRLELLGYKVTVVPSGDVGSAFTITDAETFDLLLISESISSSAADPLIGANVPMMHNESFGWDNHGLIDNANKAPAWVDGNSIYIVNDIHPIIADAGLSTGQLQFFSSDAAWTADLLNALAPGADIIAKTTIFDGNNIIDYALVFAIEQGAELANGAAAANRIVGFSVPADQPYDADRMTDEAWALWDATIGWLHSKN